MTGASSLVRKLPWVPVYPLLIALVPVLNLYSFNNQDLFPVDLLRPSLVYGAIALCLVMVSARLSGSMRAGAILATMMIISMITYGHALQYLHVHFDPGLSDQLFLAAWSGISLSCFIGLAVSLRRARSKFLEITLLLNVFGAVMILFPLFFLAPVDRQLRDSATAHQFDGREQSHEWLPGGSRTVEGKRLPDVYFIVTDGYARDDVLRTRFGFDNSGFIGWLESRGFRVARQSHANYPWTHLSLGATLNAQYLQTLLPVEFSMDLPVDARQRFKVLKKIINKRYIDDNRVYRFFDQLGYRFVITDSGTAVARSGFLSIGDTLLGPLNEFEQALLSQSALQPLLYRLSWIPPVQVLQASVLSPVGSVLAGLEDIAATPGPKFVFCHVISPHKPFSFDENGRPVAPHPVFDASLWTDDSALLPGFDAWYRENYPRNVAGLNRHLQAAIDGILSSSASDPVIVIQADHGSALGLDPQSAAATDMAERFGILSAIHLPGEYPGSTLDSPYSSVNTFPLLLNSLFGLDVPVLENRAYFSYGDLEFEEVTGRIHP